MGSSELGATPHDSRPDLFDPKARSGSVAAAFTSDPVDLIAAYARRGRGNYFAGKHGREKYREFDKWGCENDTVAKSCMAGEDVLNISASTDRYYLDPRAQSYMPAPGRTFRAGLTVRF